MPAFHLSPPRFASRSQPADVLALSPLSDNHTNNNDNTNIIISSNNDNDNSNTSKYTSIITNDNDTLASCRLSPLSEYAAVPLDHTSTNCCAALCLMRVSSCQGAP